MGSSLLDLVAALLAVAEEPAFVDHRLLLLRLLAADDRNGHRTIFHAAHGADASLPGARDN